MAGPVIVLAVVHQIQGSRFEGFVNDPSYRQLLEDLVNEHAIDFVFEEAAGRSPSVAEEFAKSKWGPDHYLDVDPSLDERPTLGIAEHTELRLPIEGTGDSYSQLLLEDNRKREELWVKSVLGQNCRRGLMVCGIAHGLSLSCRLTAAGVRDLHLFTYVPYSKLCALV